MPRLKSCPTCRGLGDGTCEDCDGSGKVLAHLKPLGPGTTEISECGLYRRTLTRDLGAKAWNELLSDRPLGVIGLNPSVARHDIDDPTIRKECYFTTAWRCGQLVKENAYDYRSTDPKAMFAAAASGVVISTPENDLAIARLARLCIARDGMLLAAWGKPSLGRAQAVLHAARIAAIIALVGDCPLLCVGVNGDDSPKHPLYLPNETMPQPWRLKEAV